MRISLHLPLSMNGLTSRGATSAPDLGGSLTFHTNTVMSIPFMSAGTDPPEGEQLTVQTFRGEESTPWQFSLSRTADAIVMRQARGPEDEFNPIEKRYSIETQPLGDTPKKFQHAISRRVWKEDPDRPHVTSQRSEGRKVLFLYRDSDGWHIDEPEPVSSETPHDTGSEYEVTNHPGLSVSTTYLRAEDGNELKFTEERTYRVSREILDAYEEVYVLACDELNEESVDHATWEVENAVACHLEPE